jgi:transketolase
MGNDDITTFDAVGELRIIDVSCPQQMLSIMKWIMNGNQGMLYVRVMRNASAVLYPSDYTFEFGKAAILRQSENDSIAVISSGRGVHEALAAAELCAKENVGVTVVDMPSVDDALLLELYNSGKILFFAEQNNGYLWQNFLKVLYRNRDTVDPEALKRTLTINTLNADGKPQFIHSATYEELTAAFGLTPAAIADVVESGIAALRSHPPQKGGQ